MSAQSTSSTIPLPGGTMTDSISHAQMLSTMRKQRFQDFMFHKVTMLFALSVLIVLVGIIISLIMESIPAFKTFGLHFIVSAEWDPVNDQYGALIPIIGTLVTSIIALLIAFPVSFGIALFLTEICPAWLRRPLGTAVELLAGVPSIIYGIWGLFVFAPLFADHVQPVLKATLGNVPFIGPLFSGPMMGIGLLTAVPRGRRSQAGQISVRNSAIPKLTGKAISSAMIDVTRVPMMGIRAPYWSLTGSHSAETMKCRPKVRKAGIDSMISEMMMPTSTTSTDMANSIVTLWNRKSWMRCLRMVESIAA